MSRITITPQEAAALDRLLDAYIVTDLQDPGRDALGSFLAKLRNHPQDHSAYES